MIVLGHCIPKSQLADDKDAECSVLGVDGIEVVDFLFCSGICLVILA